MPKGMRERGSCQPGRVNAVISDWDRLLARLPAGWEARARAHQAFVRWRAFASAGDLLRLVLAASVFGWGHRMVAEWAALQGVAQVSGEAVGLRVRQAHAWLSAEVGQLLHLRRERWSGRAVRVRLVDATTISEPGRRGTSWRAHAVIDLEHGAFCGLELTDNRGAESLVRHPLEPGEIAVADRAYGRRTDFGRLLSRGSDLVVRIGWRNLPLEAPAGEPFALPDWLTTLGSEPTERAVQVQTPTGSYPLRVIAAPLPPKQAAEARRRCRQNAKRKQRTVDQRSLLAAGFIVLVTTLDPTAWPCTDVLALYRCRWQIEVLFKRLKSIWRLDQLRARDPKAAQAFILGVILAALLTGEVRRSTPIPLDAWLDDPDHPLSRWRWAVLWHEVALAAIRGPLDLLSLQRTLPTQLWLLCDPPRQRPHQATHARLLIRSHASYREQRSA